MKTPFCSPSQGKADHPARPHAAITSTHGTRRADLDFLKGILIVLVVAFHLAYIGDTYPQVKQVVYAFHMPLFLVISGYLMNVSKPWKEFVMTLLGYAVPYLVMESGYIVMASMLPIREHIDHLTVGVFLDRLFLHPLGPYWYLLTLIVCGTAYALVTRMARLTTVSRLVLLCAICILLSMTGIVNIACTMYFLAGTVIRQTGNRFEHVFRPTALAIVPFLILAVGVPHPQMETLSGVLMTYLVASFSLSLYQHAGDGARRFVAYLGRKSMPIFLFSPIFTFPCRQLIPLFQFDPYGILFLLSSLIICISGSLAVDWLMSQTGASRLFYVRRTRSHVAQPAQNVVEVGHDHE